MDHPRKNPPTVLINNVLAQTMIITAAPFFCEPMSHSKSLSWRWFQPDAPAGICLQGATTCTRNQSYGGFFTSQLGFGLATGKLERGGPRHRESHGPLQKKPAHSSDQQCARTNYDPHCSSLFSVSLCLIQSRCHGDGFGLMRPLASACRVHMQNARETRAMGVFSPNSSRFMWMFSF